MSKPSDVTVTDLPVAPPVFIAGPAPSLFDRYKGWMSDKPWYYHVAAVVLVAIMSALITKYVPALAPFMPDPATVAKAPPAAAPPAAAPPAAAEQERFQETWQEKVERWKGYKVEAVPQKIGEGHRLIAEHFRRRVERQLEHDWLKSVGGPDKTPANTTAHVFANKLSDQVVVDALHQAGAFRDAEEGGPILGFLQRVAKWIADHPEQVQAIIKILLMILMAFGDPVSLNLDLMPDGSVWVTAVYERGSVVACA